MLKCLGDFNINLHIYKSQLALPISRVFFSSSRFTLVLCYRKVIASYNWEIYLTKEHKSTRSLSCANSLEVSDCQLVYMGGKKFPS